MRITPSEIPDVLLIEPKVFGDERGFFFESWNERDFARAGITARFVQDNHSRSQRHVLRGLHYQVKSPQGKIVRVTEGEVFDVALDIRRSSPAFGRAATAVLSAARHNMIWIPPGFAHGFLVLSEYAEVLYKATDYWAPEHERTILWNDPDLGIGWPLAGAAPILSAKDRSGAPLRDAETYP
ncbi:MAG: dTDP-4-dehydrorhamnose 3,5-epimerase [Betaproteobacteria bacterium]|nr:dTDP-4-dehydrorhamnose 3,5-epimerase [Betaproteobacteria bacterium]MBI2961304.1 dTDP-4-dehydrorhamnose 3,5-epimerase [Betaproteobacteria bacterium]